MSEEQLRLVRRLHDAFNQGDFEDAAHYLHPDFEIHPAIAGPDWDRQYRGPQGAKDFWEVITEVWEEVVVEIEELIQAPEDRILAFEQWRMRGRDGIALEAELGDLYAFRDGLIIRVDGFSARSEALEAAGLKDEGPE